MKTVYILMIATYIGSSSNVDVWDVYSTPEAAIKAAEEKAKTYKNCGYSEIPTDASPLYIKAIGLRRTIRNICKEILVMEKTVR